MNNLGNIVLNEKKIDLNKTSKKALKDILNKVSEEELILKQELDNLLKRLV